MDAVADRERFAVLYPMALSGRWAYSDSRPVKLLNSDTQVDDIGFLNALLDKLIAERVVDASRIYVAGVSNGALMAWTLACHMADRLLGVAPIISGMTDRQVEQCQPNRLVPLIVVAGTDDRMQPYDGALGEGFRLLSIPETLEFWRRKRGCTKSAATDVPRREFSDPTRAVLVDWTECKDPSLQRFYRIEGGGHSLPSFAPLPEGKRRLHGGRSQAIETAEDLWKFFLAATP